MDSRATGDGLIFVLGPSPRSGTNYLCDLIKLLPDVVMIPNLWEDYVIHHSQHLVTYADRIQRSWSHAHVKSQYLEPWREQLLASLGGGVVDFLWKVAKEGGHTSPALRLLSRSPRALGVDNYPRLLPGAKVVVIVRDGRATAESARRSWGTKLAAEARSWANNARAIARARDGGVPFALIHYEHLLTDLRASFSPVLTYLGVDPTTYDWAAAEARPVRGSSVFARNPDGSLNWMPTKRTDEFRPLERFSSWTRSDFLTYEAIAGDQLEAFGYGPCTPRRALRTRAAQLASLVDLERFTAILATSRLAPLARSPLARWLRQQLAR